jgi:alkylation response protein AidB-like acyl-CoA dehydrogenase
MDFAFTEEQDAVADLAAQILGDACDPEHLRTLENADGDGIDHALWRALGEANLLGVALPEQHGGSELGLLALCRLLEEAGRHLAPVPLLPTLVCAALPLAEFGSQAQKQRWLQGVASGETILSAALDEVGSIDPARPRLTARAAGQRWILDGEKVCVPAAGCATRVLVPARLRDGSVGVFLVDPGAKGVRLEEQRANNHERQYRMQLEGVEVGPEDVLGDPAGGAAIVAWLEQRAQVALCAMQVGVAEEALRRTAEYTSTRKQFGRAIGTFQGVALRAADAYIDVEAMRSTLWQAAFLLESEKPAQREVAAAKWWACRGGQRVVHTAQHLHGGTGSDIDYPIHRYFLWARQLELTLGGASQQLARLGNLIAQADAAAG